MAVLGALYRIGDLTIGELAGHERVQPPSMTRTVNCLEEGGYVARRAHDTDGRQVLVVAHRVGPRDRAGRPGQPRRLAGPAPARPRPRGARRAPRRPPPSSNDSPKANDTEGLISSLSPTFRALVNPNYRRYLAGSVVSNTGTWMQRVAQDWLVLQLPGNSGTALGITTGLQFLPVLLLSPYAGVIADRFPKRRLLQLTQLSMAFASLLLGVLAVTGVAQTWQVYVIAFVFGIGSAFDAPARQSFVSEMVGPDDLTNAVGLNSATFNVARIAGPGLAGLMIGALGGGVSATGWVILINAASYAAVIWQLQLMDPRLLHTAELRPKTPGMLVEGVRYVRSQPEDGDDPDHGVLRGHLRDELPDHLRPDGHAGLRQGRGGVRHPRLGHGGRLA